MEERLNGVATVISNDRLTELHQNAKAFKEEHQWRLSMGENDYLDETIQLRSVPTPKLLIKDHKKRKMGNTHSDW